MVLIYQTRARGSNRSWDISNQTQYGIFSVVFQRKLHGMENIWMSYDNWVYTNVFFCFKFIKLLKCIWVRRLFLCTVCISKIHNTLLSSHYRVMELKICFYRVVTLHHKFFKPLFTIYTSCQLILEPFSHVCLFFFFFI